MASTAVVGLAGDRSSQKAPTNLDEFHRSFKMAPEASLPEKTSASADVPSLKAFHTKFKIALSTDPAVARPTSEHQPGPNVIAKLLAGPAMAGAKAYDSTTAAAAGSGPGSDSSRKPAADMSMPATADGNATDITVGVPVEFKLKKKKKKKLKVKEQPTFEDKYELTGKSLGSGSFSTVEECRQLGPDGRLCAAKIVDKASARSPTRQQIFRELDILMECRGQPNIVQLFDFFEQPATFCFVFEKLDGGVLLEHIRARQHFTEREASFVTRDIATALVYLHNCGIAHRDLKPDNVLCVRKDCASPAKVCDFNLGSEKQSSGSSMPLLTPVGTPEYMAPEVVDAITAGEARHYDKRCDVWSLGVIVYIMLSGYPPFSGDCGTNCGWKEGRPCEECAENLLEQIQDGYFDFPKTEWGRISGAAKDLIARALVRADERITTENILVHPWIRQGGPSTPLMTPDLLRARSNADDLATFAADANVKNRQIGDSDQPGMELASPNGALFQRRQRRVIATPFSQLRDFDLLDVHTPSFSSVRARNSGSPAMSSPRLGSLGRSPLLPPSRDAQQRQQRHR